MLVINLEIHVSLKPHRVKELWFMMVLSGSQQLDIRKLKSLEDIHQAHRDLCAREVRTSLGSILASGTSPPNIQKQ